VIGAVVAIDDPAIRGVERCMSHLAPVAKLLPQCQTP
jgi:hypothetical protein